MEDEDAFALGFGFADLIRRPTRGANELSAAEKTAAVADLIDRIEQWTGRPLIVFRYKAVQTLADQAFAAKGYATAVLPSPYERRDLRDGLMQELKNALSGKAGARF